MSCSAKNVANAVGGKTARACDNCITKRARWYCAADDAFLCQPCDSSVHSANSLARRHQRVRLKTSSSSINSNPPAVPTWHHGFTKKARTPRQHGKPYKHYSRRRPSPPPFHLVPELVGLDELISEENEAQLLYRVPIFDPFLVPADQLCTNNNNTPHPNPNPNPPSSSSFSVNIDQNENKVQLGDNIDDDDDINIINNHHHEMESCFNSTTALLLPSDIELAEFAADVESLLGRGMEDECIGMEDLGLIQQQQELEESWECCSVKMEAEQEEGCYNNNNKEIEIIMGKESTFELNFDYDDDDSREEVEEKKDVVDPKNENKAGKRKISLQLDYEAVMNSWDGQKCPWTTGHKPNLDAHQEYCMGVGGMELHHYPNYYGGELGCHPTMTDHGGREARVSRYREKRRTRLFSKKIRYEVRKLNAEKRPRMKGRFVKRASFAPPTFPLLK